MQPRFLFLLGLVVFTIVQRMLPYVLTTTDVTANPSIVSYPWNFTPLMALCLLSGGYIADRRWKFGMPILVRLVSDIGILIATGKVSSAFQSDWFLVYLCMALTVMMGQGLNRRAWPVRGIDALSRGMLAEVIFFVVTNFGYFCVQPDHSFSGLIACYVAAIPFAGKSFAGTAIYSVLLLSPLAVGSQAKDEIVEPNLQPVRA